MEINKGKFLINAIPPIHYPFDFTIIRNKCIYTFNFKGIPNTLTRIAT